MCAFFFPVLGCWQCLLRDWGTDAGVPRSCAVPPKRYTSKCMRWPSPCSETEAVHYDDCTHGVCLSLDWTDFLSHCKGGNLPCNSERKRNIPQVGNGRNNVLRVLFQRKLTEPH